TVTAHILIDGETTPITKTATYKVVRTVPKHVFETARGVLYPYVEMIFVFSIKIIAITILDFNFKEAQAQNKNNIADKNVETLNE
ncbi:hypothetical protein, partial [Staphylococcus aureus]|uniref:hypothetical protein n=1 Tax=Staphylococcus aureus TaxID=1280 RepID=UPI001F11B585